MRAIAPTAAAAPIPPVAAAERPDEAGATAAVVAEVADEVVTLEDRVVLEVGVDELVDVVWLTCAREGPQ